MEVGCTQAMELMNTVFSSGLVLNDGHEIYARLEAGDDVATVIDDLNKEFGNPRAGKRIQQVMENWPPLHLELVTQAVTWALSKLDTDDRVMINWKGDADNPETVTKIELRDKSLLIEFAHPPFSDQPAEATQPANATAG